jgi:hypothetical protein
LFISAEEENYIKVKPGLAGDNYQVTVKIQVFDIFIDYMECKLLIYLSNFRSIDLNT